MSRERELLKRFMIELTTEEDVVSLFNDIKECLAQPEQDKAGAVMPNGVCVSNVYDAYEEGRKSVMVEQEPVAWMQDSIELYVLEEKSAIRGYVIPLYTAPPTREPLSKVQYMKCFTDTYENLNPITDFVRAIEKAHGIGGGE